jgi:hypothetical protein
MRGIALSTTDAFSGTDFSLCGFDFADGTPHRLKPVLQDRTKPRCCEHAEY